MEEEKSINKLDKPKVVFVLGGPGVGKGTQCAKIVEKYGYIHLSAGELLREFIKTGGKDGELVDTMIKEGKVVPAYITTNLLRNTMISRGWNQKFLIDGYPRSFENLNSWINEMSDFIDFQFILYLESSFDTMTQRVLKRGETSEQTEDGQQRTDDNIESLQQRLDVFQQQSKPIIELFAKTNHVLKINAESTPDEVFKSLQPHFSRPPVYRIIGGTQTPLAAVSKQLEDEFKLVSLNLSKLIQHEIASGSDRGVTAKSLISENKPIPSELAVDLLENEIKKSGKQKAFLLEGFPRNNEDNQAWNLRTRLIFDTIVTIFLASEQSEDQDKTLIENLYKENRLISVNGTAEFDDVYNNAKLTFLPKPKVVFVLGGPGSGQGTQCDLIVQNFGFLHLSAGDLLREERASGSKDAQLIESIIKQGKIVPSHITTGLLKKAMIKGGWGKNVLIDGYPRNQENFDSWKEIMGNITVFKFVLYLECSFDTMTARVIQRSKKSGRSDDTPDVLVQRFQTYLESTKPVIEYYNIRKRVQTIDSEKGVDEVYSHIKPLFENI